MEKMKLNIQRFSLTVTLTATETAIDDTAIANNQSYINLSIRVQTGAPTWNGEKSAYYQVTTTSTNEGEKTGSKYYFSIGSSSGSGDKTFPVTLGPFSHNSDGSLANVAISVYVRITSSTHTTKTKNVPMATIPRASDIDEIDDGTTPYYPTIKWTPKNNTFKYKVQYVSSDGTTTLTSDFISPNKTTQHEYSSLQIPNSFFNNVTGNYKQTVKAKLYTYKSDETPVVEDPTTKDFTVTLSESIKPNVSISNIAEAGNIVPSSWGIYVKGKSKISYRVNYSFPTPVPNSAAILVSCNGATQGSNAVISTSSQYKTFGTSSYLANTGSLSITAAVTDSRTRKTASVNTATNVVDYDVPDVTLSVYRCNSSGTASDSGTYYHYSISGHYQSCKNGSTEKNSITTLKVGYRLAGSTGSFTEVSLTPTVGSTANNRVAFTATGTTGGGNISTANNYEIQVRAIDVLSGQANALSSITAQFKLVSYKADGKGIAIGKKSTTTNLLEVALPTKITQPLTLESSVSGFRVNYIGDTTYSTAGDVNLYDRTLIDSINANRTAFFPGDKVYIEHSTNGGSSWTEYTTSSFSNDARKNVFSMTRGSAIPIATTTPITTSMQCRITIKYPGNDNWYCSLDRLFLFFNKGGHTVKLDMEVSTYGAQSTYTKIMSDRELNGWSGPNVLSFGNRTAWGSNSSAHVYNIRLTFKVTSVNSSYTTNKPSVNDIRFFGKNFWGTAGTPRYNGSLFTWDYNQNVNFPANVSSNGNRLARYNELYQAHPVGSVLITTTNTQPTFGGSWSLIDKEFSSATGTSGYTINSTNCTAVGTFSWVRSGHNITLTINFTNKVQIKDDTLTMFTINYATLGITQLQAHYYGQLYSDAAKCSAFYHIEATTGNFNTVDVIPDNYISAGRTDNRTTVTFNVPKEYMVDSACDKFYWKRTA